MPNHFHLLVKEHTEGGVTMFMRKLLTSHSMYINAKYKRTGTLFEGPFKATHADTDEYLKYLFAYIHLNPIKLIDKDWKEKGVNNPEKAKDYLGKYWHSSYPEYINGQNKRREAKILNKEAFPGYFDQTGDFESMLKDFLNYQNLDL